MVPLCYTFCIKFLCGLFIFKISKLILSVLNGVNTKLIICASDTLIVILLRSKDVF